MTATDENRTKGYAGQVLSDFDAHEIEVLAPACDDDDVREDNSEYPWIDGKGEVQTHCEYSFSNINDGSRSITRLILLLRATSEAYAGV